MQWERWNHQLHNKRMQLIGTEGVQGETLLGGQGDPLGNVQEIWPCQQIVYAQPSTCARKWLAQTPMRLWYTNGSPNLGQKTRPYNNQQQKKKKKKKISKIVDFAVLADHRIKLKECEKRDKYLYLAWELKKTMEHEGDNYTNCDWCFDTVTKGL